MSKSKFKDNICPLCLSKLIDEEGSMVCSGSKLELWVNDFKQYEKMNKGEKKKFLISFSDSERFIELYNKWNYLDENGHRTNFSCGYTNQIFNPLPENRMYLPDPLQVKKLEQKLNRELTEEEVYGERVIDVDGKQVTIKQMVFPDDF